MFPHNCSQATFPGLIPYYELHCVSFKKDMWKPYPLEPQNINVFGSRIFTDIIKLK